MSSRFRGLTVGTMLVALSLTTGDLAAQALWVDRAPRRSLDLSFARPVIAGSEQGLLSGAARFAGTFSLGGSTLLQLELPVARADFGGPLGGESAMQIGAPYIGLVGGTPEAGVRVQVGVRLAPWESEGFEAMVVGAAADYERLEAHLSEFVGLRSSVQFGSGATSGAAIQGRIGGTALIPTRDGADPEVLVDYGVRIGTEAARGFLFADLSGRLWATVEGLSFGERTTHFLGLSGGYTLGGITPTAELRLPLGEEDSEVDRIVRIGVRVRW